MWVWGVYLCVCVCVVGVCVVCVSECVWAYLCVVVCVLGVVSVCVCVCVCVCVWVYECGCECMWVSVGVWCVCVCGVCVCVRGVCRAECVCESVVFGGFVWGALMWTSSTFVPYMVIKPQVKLLTTSSSFSLCSSFTSPGLTNRNSPREASTTLMNRVQLLHISLNTAPIQTKVHPQWLQISTHFCL